MKLGVTQLSPTKVSELSATFLKRFDANIGEKTKQGTMTIPEHNQ